MTANLLTDPPAEQPPAGDSLVKGQSTARELSSPDGEIGTVACRQQSPEPENMNMKSPVKEQSQTGKQSSSDGDDGTVPSEQSPAGEEAPTSDLPPYLQILKNVLARSGPTDNEELTFTFDEICYLAADRDFNRIYPEQAAQMQMILKKMNSS